MRKKELVLAATIVTAVRAVRRTRRRKNVAELERQIASGEVIFVAGRKVHVGARGAGRMSSHPSR